jgi:hypothetical protein
MRVHFPDFWIVCRFGEHEDEDNTHTNLFWRKTIGNGFHDSFHGIQLIDSICFQFSFGS